MKKLFFLLFCLAMAASVSGQTDTIYNTHSLEKIPYYEQLYRFRVWREVDFKEKQNAGLFHRTRILLPLFLIT
ncbi:MAG: hypothetical protein ORN54_01360 [Cyclobacteriaceae bacterium]|nr:hypothetical protein [Cyclobacteriaceae bacterium]